jgi:hypothetical protein
MPCEMLRTGFFFFSKKVLGPGMVLVYTYNPTTQKTAVGKSQVQEQPGIRSETLFQNAKRKTKD